MRQQNLLNGIWIIENTDKPPTCRFHHIRSYLFSFLNDFISGTTPRHWNNPTTWFMSAIHVIKISIQGIKIIVKTLSMRAVWASTSLLRMIKANFPAYFSFARPFLGNKPLSIFRAAKSRLAAAHLMRRSLKENLIKFLIMIAANNLWIISRLLVKASSLAIILTSYAV